MSNSFGSNLRPLIGTDIRIKKKININVPIVFHIMCDLGIPNDKIDKQIDVNIIPSINRDFNRNQKNLQNYPAIVRTIFSNYPNKGKLYMFHYFKILKNTDLVLWNFYHCTTNFYVNNTNPFTGSPVNDNSIIDLSPAMNPNMCVNIWINSYGDIDGSSVYPWDNRLPDKITLDPLLEKYHGIKINKNVFGPNFPLNFERSNYTTFSHEIGHYFGLLNTFDNTSYASPDFQYNNLLINYNTCTDADTTDDLIVDTPYQILGTVPKVLEVNKDFDTHLTNIFNDANDYDPMFMNLMDTTPDNYIGRRYFFTRDQQFKMIYFIERYYPSILSSIVQQQPV
jgi:hypothetical protein